MELIVENITRGTLVQAIRSQILKPLGLKHTFTELREPTIGEVATGYGDRNKDGKLDSYAEVNDGNGLGDGGLVSTRSHYNHEPLQAIAYCHRGYLKS